MSELPKNIIRFKEAESVGRVRMAQSYDGLCLIDNGSHDVSAMPYCAMFLEDCEATGAGKLCRKFECCFERVEGSEE